MTDRAMELFHVIDDAFVVLRGKNGIYRQAKIFQRGGELFAGFSGGFIGLRGNGGTTSPVVSWTDISVEHVALPARGLYLPDAPALAGPTQAKRLK